MADRLSLFRTSRLQKSTISVSPCAARPIAFYDKSICKTRTFCGGLFINSLYIYYFIHMLESNQLPTLYFYNGLDNLQCIWNVWVEYNFRVFVKKIMIFLKIVSYNGFKTFIDQRFRSLRLTDLYHFYIESS